MDDPWMTEAQRAALHQLLANKHYDPHSLLGAHPSSDGMVVRTFQPTASFVRVLPEGMGIAPLELERVHEDGLFAGLLRGAAHRFPYRLEVHDRDGSSRVFWDPYSFAPTLGPLDLHLFAEGKHRRLYRVLGARPCLHEGVSGVAFAVWAPAAKRVSVVGDFNRWDGAAHPMRRLDGPGVWELFVPELPSGAHYKFELLTPNDHVVLKLDPFARQTQLRPQTAGVLTAPSNFAWSDDVWMKERATKNHRSSPLSFYEVHLGSFRRTEAGTFSTWKALGDALRSHVETLGFTHVELLPVMEHPFDGSWGYQVTGYYAPTARFGGPDELRGFVAALHHSNIGVVLDWVPAHFPKDAHALGRFDGTARYEHADPRRGEHPDWGTLVFELSRPEVRNFLLANALYWFDEFHVDGLRVDAVASMLYLDYSRAPGQWIPNKYGGRENLDAVAFFRELNDWVHEEFPGALVIAEESTSWPAVTRETYVGGLGFSLKWNMGWMHDTLRYFSTDPLFRRYHHGLLTFAMMYAYSERFVLSLSHDEVVHLKRSLLGKMPGDRWQQHANLRALFSFLWTHPGRKLLFMGGEFAQPTEWNHDAELPWSLREDTLSKGMSALIAALNRLYRTEPALHELDDDPKGFQWSVVDDSEQSVFAFVRYDSKRERPILCVLNATPLVRQSYVLGVPSEGHWKELLNSDAAEYGGSNVGNLGGAQTLARASHGFPFALSLTLPPLGMLLFLGPPVPPEPVVEEAIVAPSSVSTEEST